MIGARGAPASARVRTRPGGLRALAPARARPAARSGTWAAASAGLVVLLSVAAWAAFLRGRAPATAWDTQSFTEYAAQLAHRHLPPVGLRLPGYPAFLLLTGGRGLDLHRIVAAQVLLWIASNALVFEAVRRLTRSALAGLAAALVVLSFADLLFLAITVYSELLCLFLVDAAALATVVSLRPGRRGWIPAAAALWMGAALVRPVFLLAAGAYAAVALGSAIAGRLDRRATAIACCGVAAATLAVAAANRVRAGQLQFALGSGLSLLDYVGHPGVYQALPPDQAPVRELFVRLAREGGDDWVGWWRSAGALAGEAGTPADAAACERVARASGTSWDFADCDRIVRRVAVRALRAAPAGYLAVWRGTARAFLTDFDLFYGWYERPGAPAPQWSARTWQHRAVTGTAAFWQGHLGLVTYGSLLLPLAALALLLAARRRPGGPPPGTAVALATLAAILAAGVLASTALEPWPGQMRYRYPLQHLHVVVAVASAVLIGGSLSRLARGGSAAPSARGAPSPAGR